MKPRKGRKRTEGDFLPPFYNLSMGDFKLSDNFTFYELTDSDEHPDLVDANREACTTAHRDQLRILCEALLEEVRFEFRRPVIILSGFRSDELNAAVNGSATSQHKLGQAADFFVKGVSVRRVYDWIKGESGLIYHQLILYPGRNFIHVSLPTGSNDGQSWVEG